MRAAGGYGKRPGRDAAGRCEHGAAGLRGRAAKDNNGIIARFLHTWGVEPGEAARIAAASAVLVLLACVVLPRLMYAVIAPMKGWC